MTKTIFEENYKIISRIAQTGDEELKSYKGTPIHDVLLQRRKICRTALTVCRWDKELFATIELFNAQLKISLTIF